LEEYFSFVNVSQGKIKKREIEREREIEKRERD
jgi:hypothetical protein